MADVEDHFIAPPALSFADFGAPDLAAHFWVVAGAPDAQHREDIRETATRVYSSAAVAYVPVTDESYKAWVAAGNAATPIDTEDNLHLVLSGLGLPSGFGPGGAAPTAPAA